MAIYQVIVQKEDFNVLDVNKMVILLKIAKIKKSIDNLLEFNLNKKNIKIFQLILINKEMGLFDIL
jgi:hypothetical protein